MMAIGRPWRHLPKRDVRWWNWSSPWVLEGRCGALLRLVASCRVFVGSPRRQLRSRTDTRECLFTEAQKDQSPARLGFGGSLEGV